MSDQPVSDAHTTETVDPTISRETRAATEALGVPPLVVDDVTVLAGRHPRRDELERYAGLNPTKDAQPQGGCCGPQQEAPAASTGCCGQPATTSTVSGCC